MCTALLKLNYVIEAWKQIIWRLNHSYESRSTVVYELKISGIRGFWINYFIVEVQYFVSYF